MSGQPWACHGALQGQMQPLLCAAVVVGPALGAEVRPDRWFVGCAVLPVCGAVQRKRQHLATTAHRALPVCGWPALGMPWCTARSNAASAVCSSFEESGTGGCGRAEQVVSGVAVLLLSGDFVEGEAALFFSFQRFSI